MADRGDLEARRRRLSPEKRSLLERRLRDSERDRGTRGDDPPALVPDPQHAHEPFPLTEIQEAYWIGRSEVFELGATGTHSYSELESSPALDGDRLEAALGRLVERHPMLRAVLDGEGRQRVLPEVPAPQVPVMDLRAVSPEEAEARRAETRRAMEHQVFDPQVWPLFDLRLALLDGDRSRLYASFDVLFVDGSSVRLLLEELWTLYADPATPLRPVEVTFRDYVLALEEMRRGPAFERSEAYWKDRLEELPPSPALPLAHDPGSLRAPRFGRRHGRLDATAWRRLQGAGAASRLTPSALVLAAYAEVLGRWSETPHFCVNLTVYHRLPLHPAVGEVVGNFTHVTVLEVDGTGDTTFRRRCTNLQERLWADLEHTLFDGVRVMRELASRRPSGAERAPVMPVVFTSLLSLGAAAPSDESTPAGQAGLGESAPASPPPTLEPVYGLSQTPQVWLDCQVMEVGGELVFQWDAVEELFPPGVLDAMFGAFESLVRHMADSAEVWEQARPQLLSDDELARRRRWNDTGVERPDELIHDEVLRRCRDTPDALAVTAPEARLSYGELDIRSATLAGRLGELGTASDRLVAVVLEPGWEQVVAVLGVVRADAAYVPLDPAAPPDRLRRQLDIARVFIVLTTPDFAEGIPWPDGVHIETVTDDLGAPVRAGGLPSLALPGDLAYVIFTSGSTGDPKGVMIEHRAARVTLDDVNERFAVGPRDRVLAVSNLTFDLSVYDLFGLLGAGGVVVHTDPARHRDPAHWLARMHDEDVTVWNSAPALLEMLLEWTEASGAGLPDSLRLVLVSGDWVPLDLADRLRRLRPGLEVVSLGGATEAAVWSIFHRIQEVEPGWRSIPYGRPLSNQTLHVLDEHLDERPMQVPGDLYIGGQGLLRGYWRDPDLSAAKIVVHPRTGERLYRTGDRARHLPTGELEFLGRSDFQVKIDGHRIELGEIEHALRRQDRAREAVALVQGGALAAFVTLKAPEPDESSSGPDADRRLSAKLARPGERTFPDSTPSVELPAPEVRPEERWQRWSHRRYLARPVPLESLAALLAGLVAEDLDGRPKYRYPSAGHLYGVQVHLSVAGGRVEGLAAGSYYLDPRGGRLVRVSAEGHDPRVHGPANRGLAAEAAFTVLLTADVAAVEAAYPERGHEFALLEAGHIGQLLMALAHFVKLGLCPVGEVDGEAVCRQLGLGASHQVLYSLIGGAVETTATPAWSLRSDESGSPTRAAAGEAIRKALEETLPVYAIPRTVTVLDRLPLTASGKIDRRALARRADADSPAVPETPASSPTGRPGGRSPDHPMAELVAGVMTEVLGRPIGLDQHFFASGGNSLHATRVVARLRRTLRRELPLAALYEAATPRAIAAELVTLHRATASGVQPPTVDASPPEPDDRPPLTFGQESLWLLHRLAPASTVYNTLDAVRLRGPLDVAALEAAAGDVVRRHQVLRTSFPAGDDGVPWQRVEPFDPPRLEPEPLLVDGGDRTAVQAALRPLADAELGTPFDLAAGPPLRLRLLRVGDDDHVLLIAAHHIVTDGWSATIWLRELSTSYEARRAGRDPDLPELALQVTGVAREERDAQQEGTALDEALDTWRRRLAGAPGVLELATDHPRAAAPPAAGAWHRFTVPAELTERLEAFSRGETVTLFMTLLAVFGELLARYSGQRDLVVGTPVAGRTRVETEALVGFFVNTLPLRLEAAADDGLRSVVAAVRRTTLEAFALQEVPLERIVEAVCRRRDASRNPLFQVMLALQNQDAPELRAGELALEPLDLGSRTAKVDLTLDVRPVDGRLECFFEYATGLFEEATIDAMAGTFVELLAAAVAAPDAPLGGLPTPSRTLSGEPPGDERRDGLSRFLEQARENSAAVAVESAGGSVSYSELSAAAARLAGCLVAGSPLAPEEPVVVLALPSPASVAAVLAVWWAGGAYVPLDAAFPPGQVERLVAETGARRALVSRELADRLEGFDGELRVIEDAFREIPQASPLPSPAEPLPGSLAYVLYTSGSSGAPKGVAIPHVAIANRLAWADRQDLVTASDRVLLHTPLCFDVSVCEMLEALGSGAALVVPEPAVARRPDALAGWLAERRVSVANLVPSLLQEQIGEPAFSRCRGTLRRILCGGEGVRADLRDRVRERLGIDLDALYGVTEATVDSLHSSSRRTTAQSAVPLGRPLDGVEAHLLGRELQPVPPGAPGELHLGGRGLARGYLDPRRTAERFLPHPFAHEPGARLYRTGDLARLGPGGEVEMLGRADRQLKVRGIRVEAGEIEAALLSHPAVRQAAVGPTGEGRLVAHVTPRPGADLARPALRRHLRERLRRELVPVLSIRSEPPPRLPSGKLDTAALAAPDSPSGRPPKTSTELVLAAIWEEVLEREGVGADDDLFELGGHSIAAARIAARIETELGLAVPLAWLLEHPTIGELAARLDGGQGASDDGLPRGLVRLAGDDDAPDLVLVHALDGNLFAYRRLVDHLSGWTVFGLPAPETGPIDDLTALAEAHAETLAALPTSRFVLAGWSFGGTLALEVARRRAVAGLPPATVVLLDPADAGGGPDLDALLEDLPPTVARSLGKGREETEEAGCDGPVGAALRTSRAHLQALERHPPELVYEGTVHLLQPPGGDPSEWNDRAPGLHHEILIGDHHGLLTDHAAGTATALIRILRSTGRRDGAARERVAAEGTTAGKR